MDRPRDPYAAATRDAKQRAYLPQSVQKYSAPTHLDNRKQVVIVVAVVIVVVLEVVEIGSRQP